MECGKNDNEDTLWIARIPSDALSTFATFMNSVFHNKLEEFLIIYIDDIFIYSKSAKEHFGHLEYVLQKLKENDLYANKTKNEFAQMEMDFLGHVLSLENIRLDLKKILAVKEWQSLVTAKGV
jgi:uncharacterized protein YlbG (UPF0298 family)